VVSFSGNYVHGGYGSPVFEVSESTLFVMRAFFGLQSRAPFRLEVGGKTRTVLGPAPPVMHLDRSFTSISDGVIIGGVAEAETWPVGANAIETAAGELHLANLTVTGGLGYENPNGAGGAGGHGLVGNAMSYQTSTVALRGGAGGKGTPPGSDGFGVVGQQPELASIPSFGLGLGHFLKRGEMIKLDTKADGLWYLAISAASDPRPRPGLFGREGLRYDVPHFAIGPTTPRNLAFLVPNDPALEGAVLFAQSLSLDAQGRAFFSGVLPITIR
jgi:hypothetical protein